MTGFEIDFLQVGTGEKSGDAIALRFWDSNNLALGSKIFVIDGGTKDSGEELVTHINKWYGTNRIDAAILTHPDADHASGLSVVLEKMEVGLLLMHQPWDHVDAIKQLFENTGLTTLGVARNVKAELQAAHDLKKIADRKKITIKEPFMGSKGWDGLLHVLGPSVDYYRRIFAEFDCTPEIKVAPLIPTLLQKATEAVVEWIDEDWNIETLQDGTERFRPENSSSAIILFTVGENSFLFTGDADEVALNLAADYAATQSINLTNLHLLHVPHHGSKQNVGPSILNRIKAKNSQISAGLTAPKHPSYAVVNALLRRGSAVYKTQIGGVCHPSADAPNRGWTPLASLSFSKKVQK